jgi:hypothetical protein
MQLDPQTLALMQNQQQIRVLSTEEKKMIEDAEQKQCRIFSVQMAVQAGATNGGEGIVECAKIIEAYVLGKSA